MIIKDAIEEWLKLTSFPKAEQEELDNFIDKIFDDIEAQVCENCISFNSSRLVCNNSENDIIYIGWEKSAMPIQRQLSCNKWKAK